MTRRLRDSAAALCLALLVAAGIASAHAQDGESVPQRTVGVGWDEAVPQMSVSVRDLVTPEVRRKLESGLPQNLSLQVFTYHGRSAEPVALYRRTCNVAYDLWQESFRIRVSQRGQVRQTEARDLDTVLARCLTVNGVAVAPASALEGRRRIYFAVLVELNPMSDETVQRIRRWLARPSEGEGNAFFGSFVSLFVNRRLGRAERRVRFRSQWVEVPQ